MAIIEVNAVHKAYAGRPAVDGVSFAVDEGEIFGILGPNGAGKTTTVECIEGLRVPDAGTIRVACLDPVADHDRVTKLLGAQLQESELQPKLTVAEALELYSAFYPDPADWRALAERLGLHTMYGTRFAKLSGGQKQRLSIALALIGNPRVVVLDELTTGLDPRARRDTWKLIEDVRDSGVTVLLVTHFMEEANRLCDRVAVIDKGKVVALDTPSGLVSRAWQRHSHLLHPRTAARPDRTGFAARCGLRRTEERPDRHPRQRRDGQRGDLTAGPPPHHRTPTPRLRSNAGRRLPRPHRSRKGGLR